MLMVVFLLISRELYNVVGCMLVMADTGECAEMPIDDMGVGQKCCLYNSHTDWLKWTHTGVYYDKTHLLTILFNFEIII